MQELIEELYTRLVKDVTAEVEQKILPKLDTQPTLDEPLKPEKVAEYLGVDKSTIYRMCKEGQIRSIRLGSIHSSKPLIRILKKDLVEWMEKSDEISGKRWRKLAKQKFQE